MPDPTAPVCGQIQVFDQRLVAGSQSVEMKLSRTTGVGFGMGSGIGSGAGVALIGLDFDSGMSIPFLFDCN